jgi:hypothetical protein
MSHRSSFAEMKAEQGRQSEAWTVADPEIVEIFAAGIAFGLKVARRKGREPLYSPNEWRKALREAVEKAALLESQLDDAKKGMQKK